MAYPHILNLKINRFLTTTQSCVHLSHRWSICEKNFTNTATVFIWNLHTHCTQLDNAHFVWMPATGGLCYIETTQLYTNTTVDTHYVHNTELTSQHCIKVTVEQAIYDLCATLTVLGPKSCGECIVSMMLRAQLIHADMPSITLISRTWVWFLI